MSTETDLQFATNVELLDRVIDKSLNADEFITDNEVLAYAQHLSERELVDTEANRATWIAARTYYDAEAHGVDGTHPEIDREAEQERRLAFLESARETHSQKIDSLTYRLNEDRVKEMSLSMAVQASVGENAQTVVSKAKAFEAFLTGSES